MEKAATPHHPRDGNVRLGSVSSATGPTVACGGRWGTYGM